ncbi:MAG: transcriptional repressor [Candidatus Aureabacteria bacterium]|nr:transcriptional repressor [Candidatus Auribacterota bacterium]
MNPDPAPVFFEKCAQHGLKITPQRKVIYQEVMKAKDHPTADAVYKRTRKILSNISFDTVYRTLLSFTEIGIINLVEGYGEQKRFEPDPAPHHHFRCIKCHTIFDFENDSYDHIPVPDEVRKYGNVTNKRVVLEGICSKCSKSK